MVKTAVVAPIPSATTAMVIKLKARALASVRTARRSSDMPGDFTPELGRRQALDGDREKTVCNGLRRRSRAPRWALGRLRLAGRRGQSLTGADRLHRVVVDGPGNLGELAIRGFF